MKKYITEFTGTFFLVSAIAFSGNPLAIGAMLMVMVYAGGHISGAHYNPAVSFAMFIGKKMKLSQMIYYWIFQILGAFFASLLYNAVKNNSFMPSPSSDIQLFYAVLLEAVFTFALVYVIYSSAAEKKTEGNSYYGLAIGFTVLAGAFSVGNITGGVFNPAVFLGPLFSNLLNGSTEGYQNLFIYTVGPLTGGTLASFVYRYIRE